MDAPRTRVLVADDSAVVRGHVVALLRALDGIDVVGEADDVPCTLDSVRRLRPEAVVLDVAMPGGNGIVALHHIKREFPETQVIMLTNNANPFYRNSCLKAGASFFFDKSSEFDKVGEALRGLRR